MVYGVLDFVAATFARDDVESIGFSSTILYSAMGFMKPAQKKERLLSTPPMLIKRLKKDPSDPPPDFAKQRVVEITVTTASDADAGVLPTLLYHIAPEELTTMGVVVVEGPPPQPAAITPAAAADAGGV